MTVVPQDVRDLSIPDEFTDPPYTDTIIQASIDEMTLMVNLQVCDEFTDILIANMTAHDLLMRTRVSGGGPTGAGPVTAEAAGDVSRSIATPPILGSFDAYYMQTVFGQKVLAIRKQIPTTPITVCTNGLPAFFC